MSGKRMRNRRKKRRRFFKGENPIISKECVELSHTDYLDVGQLKHLKIMRQQMNFKSRHHEVILQKITKKCMDAYYDKRFVLPDHSTLAFGNKQIPGIKAQMK